MNKECWIEKQKIVVILKSLPIQMNRPSEYQAVSFAKHNYRKKRQTELRFHILKHYTSLM
jgi:hypothetical protein